MDKTELLPLLNTMSTDGRPLLEVSGMAEEGELTVSKEALSYQSMEGDSLRHRGSGSPPASPTDDFIQIQVRGGGGRRGRGELVGAGGLVWGGGVWERC